MKGRYPNIDDYNPNKKCKTLIFDMTADMLSYKKYEPLLLKYISEIEN